MKSIIVAFVFAIGLLVALPSSSSGSCSPPDQSTYVIGHFEIAPAIAIVQENAFVKEYNLLEPAAVMVKEKGGCTIEKSLNTSLIIGNTNKDVIFKALDFALLHDYVRLCQLLMVYQSQDLIQKNIAVVHRLPRDGLTQVS